MIRAVVPASIRTMCQKEMIHKPAVETMTERVNQEPTVRHQKHMVVCPTEIQVRGRMLNLVNLGENLLIRHGCLGKLRQSVVLPYSSCVLVFVLHCRPATNNENHDENRNREPNDELTIDGSGVTRGGHVV